MAKKQQNKQQSFITEDKKDKNDGNKAIRVEIKFFSDKASWLEDNQGGVDGSLHQQGLIF